MNIGNHILNIRKENHPPQEEFDRLFHLTRQTTLLKEDSKMVNLWIKKERLA